MTCFAGPEGRPCTFMGDIRNGHLQDGRLVSDGTPVAAVRRGTVDFTQPPDPWGDWLKSEWIERNWEGGHRPVTDDERDAGARFTRQLAAVDGPICEVAAGPGGGFMPAVRFLNPKARIIVNDWSPAVVAAWHDFLAPRAMAGSLCFAAFDATKTVLRPGCLAAVCSGWGFGNVTGAGPDPEQDAVARMAAALRPGGLLFAWEGLHDRAAWSHLPESRRREWEARFPLLGMPFADRVTRAGLEIVGREVQGGRDLRPDEGGIPGEAARYGITLHVQREYVLARKG